MVSDPRDVPADLREALARTFGQAADDRAIDGLARRLEEAANPLFHGRLWVQVRGGKLKMSGSEETYKDEAA